MITNKIKHTALSREDNLQGISESIQTKKMLEQYASKMDLVIFYKKTTLL